ncbi:MAG: sulfite exporter TauE/SafE family protein [Rhodospirillales bacterium]
MAPLSTDPASLALLAAVLLATGLCAGFIAGLLGVGGGIVVVPVLFQVFSAFGFDEGISMLMAVGTSLGAMVPTSLSSARSHYRHGAVEMGVFRAWAPGVVLGVCAGTLIAGFVRGQVLTGVFIVVTVLIALNLAIRGEGRAIWPALPTGWRLQGIGFAIGGVSALMGIGGGMLTVPVMTACSHPFRKAVATAAMTGMLIAIPGAIGFALAGLGAPGRPPVSIGYVNVFGFALISPATVLAAPWGARIAHTINARWLRWSFIAFLLVTAGRMLWKLVT